MAGSHHVVGVGAALKNSSSMSVGDPWPEIDSTRGACVEGASMPAARSHLEASMLRPLFSMERSKKRVVAKSSRDAHGGNALEQALE
jgi:hypothetical protein